MASPGKDADPQESLQGFQAVEDSSQAVISGRLAACVPARGTTCYAAASSCSRRTRMASLRWSRGVRSRMRTPSRWSISCWMTRASRTDASTTIGPPCGSRAWTRTVHRPLDVDMDAGKAQAALLHPLLLLARPLQFRVDQRVDRAVVLDAVHEDAVQRADLRRGEPDAHRVMHERAHARDLVAKRLSKTSIGRAFERSTGSPYLRTWASAAAPARGELGIEALRLDRVVDDFSVGLVVAIPRAKGTRPPAPGRMSKD